MKKVCEADPLEHAHCAAPMRLIALIEEPDIIERVLRHFSHRNLAPEQPVKSGPGPPHHLFHPRPDVA